MDFPQQIPSLIVPPPASCKITAHTLPCHTTPSAIIDLLTQAKRRERHCSRSPQFLTCATRLPFFHFWNRKNRNEEKSKGALWEDKSTLSLYRRIFDFPSIDTFRVNELTSMTPKINTSCRKLRVSAFKRY